MMAMLMKTGVLWDVALWRCLNIRRRLEGLNFILIVKESNPQVKTPQPFATSVNIYQSTRRNIPQQFNLEEYRRVTNWDNIIGRPECQGIRT